MAADNNSEENDSEEDSEHYDAAALGLGTSSLLLGSLSKYSKVKQIKEWEKFAKNRFAIKDSVIGIIDKMNRSYDEVNDRLGSAARRVTDVENGLSQRISDNIYNIYQRKKARELKRMSSSPSVPTNPPGLR